MRSTPLAPMGYSHTKMPQSSNELLGVDAASLLIYIGGGCLLLVLIFGIILCRLDIAAGDRRRAQNFERIES